MDNDLLKMTHSVVAGNVKRTLVLLIESGSDLKKSIEDVFVQNDMKNAIIISGFGSMREVRLSNVTLPVTIPPTHTKTIVNGPVEMLSMDGNVVYFHEIGKDPVLSCHIHVAVSSPEGKVVGGSLADGSIVWRQAEILLAELDHVGLSREPNPETKGAHGRLVIRSM